MAGLVRSLLGGCLVLAGAASVVLGIVLPVSGFAAADGPAPCTVGGPPFPFQGFCATYSGANTFYGSYGPGFPTDEGWGFCAEAPASGGDYPAPDYDYVPSGPPAGADTDSAAALGFAFSETQALGWWGGSTGQFTADQAAVAGKLLYDALVWGSPVPSMDPGVLAAYNAIDALFNQATGTTGSPQLNAALVGGGTSFETDGSVQATLLFPGTGAGSAGAGLTLSITNGTFDSPTGPTSIGISTDGSGSAVAPIFNQGGGAVAVTVSTAVGVGQAGLDFFAPTAREPTAQELAAFGAPTPLSETLQLERDHADRHDLDRQVGRRHRLLPAGRRGVRRLGCQRSGRGDVDHRRRWPDARLARARTRLVHGARGDAAERLRRRRRPDGNGGGRRRHGRVLQRRLRGAHRAGDARDR